MNVGNATELHTLNRLVLCYVNYLSTKKRSDCGVGAEGAAVVLVAGARRQHGGRVCRQNGEDSLFKACFHCTYKRTCNRKLGTSGQKRPKCLKAAGAQGGSALEPAPHPSSSSALATFRGRRFPVMRSREDMWEKLFCEVGNRVR